MESSLLTRERLDVLVDATSVVERGYVDCADGTRSIWRVEMDRNGPAWDSQ